MDEAAKAADLWEARRLLRAAAAGTLATAIEGQPFAALATPATAPDLSPLLLLSSLSEHTRHLRAEPRCALMVAGVTAELNPQTAPRLTVTGLAAPAEDALRERWLARHPYAAFYAGFGDFSLWRIEIRGAQFVGGFARAARLRPAELLPDPAAVTAVIAAEASLLRRANDEHAEGMAAIAGSPGDWRMVAVDVDGCDLAQGEVVRRIAWDAPVSDADGVLRALARLTAAAAGAATSAP